VEGGMWGTDCSDLELVLLENFTVKSYQDDGWTDEERVKCRR
jgi:hypothetical protein